MKKATIKEIGTININALQVAEGTIEMRISIEVVSEQMDITLEKLFADYYKNNPQVKQENVYYEARLIMQFNSLNPEFSMMIIIFDDGGNGNDEIWDELEVTLSEDAKKEFRKIAWAKLGEALFNL